MSDYTPTTEEVRMAYEIDPENPFFSSAAEWTGDEFDRWLAEVKAEQDKATTERILAAYEKSYMYDGVIGNERIEHDRDYFLLLVKGETSE